MDAFTLIQKFFTRMPCQECGTRFATEDVELLGEGDGYYVVSLVCHECGHHNGTAAVGVEAGAHMEELMQMDPKEIAEVFAAAAQHHVEKTRRKRLKHFKDPEFTETDRRRLSTFEVIDENDVLDAHHFIENLEADWTKHIPESLRAPVSAADE